MQAKPFASFSLTSTFFGMIYWTTMNKQFAKECVRVFAFAFVGAFIPLTTGIYTAPDWNAAKAAGVSALVAAVSVGGKALLDLLTKGTTPVPAIGILPPEIK